MAFVLLNQCQLPGSLQVGSVTAGLCTHFMPALGTTGDQHLLLEPGDFVKLTLILSAMTPTMPLQWRTAKVFQTLQNLRIIWAGISSKIRVQLLSQHCQTRP